MKTTITAPLGERKAFYTASGLVTVGPDEALSVEGLKLSDESRARLEALGWAFEGEGVEPEAAAQDEPAPEPVAPKRTRKAKPRP